VSTLVGIAIDEGLIGAVSDPVTDYLPDLAERDPRFRQITLRDLLTMSSGIRYQEQMLPLPWGDDINTYYGVDLRELALDDTQIEGPPGHEWLYNNYHPLLLGMVLERATGMSVSEYMATRLWRPLGAEEDATWNLDSEVSGFEKMESGVNAAPIDYARFGQLFLHEGEWNGTRIVSEDWVRAATASDTTTDPAEHYQYFWWVDTERAGGFYALGNFGQVHLRGPRCQGRHRSPRSRLGSRQPDLAGHAARGRRPAHDRIMIGPMRAHRLAHGPGPTHPGGVGVRRSFVGDPAGGSSTSLRTREKGAASTADPASPTRQVPTSTRTSAQLRCRRSRGRSREGPTAAACRSRPC
jgi:Beta-lactamase